MPAHRRRRAWAARRGSVGVAVDGHERVRGLAREDGRLDMPPPPPERRPRAAPGRPANSVSQRVLRASALARSCASFWLRRPPFFVAAPVVDRRRWLLW